MAVTGNGLEKSKADSEADSDVFKDITKLHVGRPNIGNRERLLERFNDILDRRWLTNSGPFVKEFEERIAERLGVRHCIAICNGTVALEIAIRALDLTGEVIVPSYTFIATAHALQWQQITPVFCDIDPATHTIDPKRIEELITPNTSAIIGVHTWGTPCDIHPITEIARRYNLKLMFDAAHAFGCSYEGRMIGNFGDAEIFSFHATKFINTFEGGAIVTNDDELASKIRLMKNFGFVGEDKVGLIGTNGKMSEISAAMGLTSLESMDDFVAVNYRNYKRYQQELKESSCLRVIRYNEAEACNYQYVIVEVDEEKAGMTRDELVEVLRNNDILARRYFYPGCHKMEPYCSYFPQAKLILPQTEEVAARVIVLPTGTAMTESLVSRVCGVLNEAVSESTSELTVQ